MRHIRVVVGADTMVGELVKAFIRVRIDALSTIVAYFLNFGLFSTFVFLSFDAYMSRWLRRLSVLYRFYFLDEHHS